MVSGSLDKSIRLWNIEAKEFEIIGNDVSYVLSVDISKNSLLIASGSIKGSLKIWNIKTKNCLHFVLIQYKK